MAKKTRMGRNLNALLGGATKNRPVTPETHNETADIATESVESAGSITDSDTLQPSASGNDRKPDYSGSPSSTSAAVPNSKPLASDTGHRDATATSPNSVSGSATNSEPAVTAVSSQPVDSHPDAHPSDRLRMLGVDQITRGEYQPRRHFDQTLLQELADSIKAQGLIQPILVRAHRGKFELIAGERRWRAAQLAGISDIPAIVRDMDDQSVAAVSLIENIQRADLNPLEEAQALERLCGEFSMTHQQVAEAVGRSRVSVTNLMRLLELHDDVKSKVDNGELDMGHARALLGAPRSEQPTLATRIIQQGLTVRAVEKLVKDLREGKKATTASETKLDPNIEALGKKLGTLLGAPVSIKHRSGGAGKLEISYSSVDELEGILSHIK